VTAADTFTLAVNSYRQAGGGGYDMLRGLPVVYDRGEAIRTLLEDAIRESETLRVADYYEPSWRLLPAQAEAALATFARQPARDTTVLRVVVTGALRGLCPRTLDGRPLGGRPPLPPGWTRSRRCGCPTFWVDAGGASHRAPVRVPQGAHRGAFNAAGIDAAARCGDVAVISGALGRGSRVPVQWTASTPLPSGEAPATVGPPRARGPVGGGDRGRG
jgi:hypothetical protein